MNLFNNPMVDRALKSMSSEQVENFRKIGNSMYGNVDHVNNALSHLPGPIAESAAYIDSGLKSGLSPSELTETEVHVLVEAYGEEWYKRYDYTKDEVPELGLSIGAKEKIEKAVEQKVAEMNNRSKPKVNSEKKDRTKNNKKKNKSHNK